jgi:hypothetical protein
MAANRRLNMKRRHGILITAFLLAAAWCSGQGAGKDTVLNGSVIEVIQTYKPQVRAASRPEWMPQLPANDTTHPVFKYAVPQQPLFYSYHSDPLKPLALGKDTVPLPLPNYVMAGVGNLTTLFLDAGIGSYSGPGYETFLHVHHLSQKGPVKFEQSALTGLEAEGMLHREKGDWHGTLGVERNQYYYYGYNHALYDYNNSDSLRQTFLDVALNADYRMKDEGESPFSVHPYIDADYYGARFKTHESDFGFDVPMSYELKDDLEGKLNVFGHFAGLAADTVSKSNVLFGLAPGAELKRETYSGHAYLGLAFGQGGTAHVLPDIEGKVDIPHSPIRVSAGWLASEFRNTYKELTTENPYLVGNYKLTQTRKDELFVNAEGQLGQLNFTGRAGWDNFKGLPGFLDTSGDRKQFSPVYDTVSALFFQMGAKYLMADKYVIGLSAVYRDFYQGTSLHPWEVPGLTLQADAAISPMAGLTLSAYLTVMSGIYALDTKNKVADLKPITDFGCNGEYRLNLQFSAFMQVSNMLNSHYQRWMGYDSYGVNIYGGVRMKF